MMPSVWGICCYRALSVRGWLPVSAGTPPRRGRHLPAPVFSRKKRFGRSPENAPALCALGLIDAALGRKEEALREGRRALDLLPVQRDALAGADLIVGFAIICAWTGESDLALEQLAIAAGIPSLLNYGQLKLHPWWDPLRGDARFENLVASLAPKPGGE